MAEEHVDAYAGVDEATVAAVASPNTASSFVAERGLDADPYSSVGAMLDRADIDAVDICTPTPTHRDLVETVVERGVDALCEKPIAGTLADATAIVDLVDDADVTFMVGHTLRFVPEYAAVRRAVQEGAIGDLGVARARRLSSFPEWGRQDWYREGSGGPLVDLAIHDLDFLRWTFGEVDRVQARSTEEAAAHTHATLRFEDGGVGYVEASWAQPEGTGLLNELEVAGDEGMLELDGAEARPVVVRTDGREEVLTHPGTGGYEAELREFVSCVESGRTPTVTAQDAVEALRLSLAATRSVETGAPVAVEEVVA